MRWPKLPLASSMKMGLSEVTLCSSADACSAVPLMMQSKSDSEEKLQMTIAHGSYETEHGFGEHLHV